VTTGDAREYRVKYRRRYAQDWEDLDLDTAMLIADQGIVARRNGWQREVNGNRTRRTLGFASLGDAG
jgi:formate dehydrogenase major subunit